MLKNGNTIKLKTGIDPAFLSDTLTTDIELTDAIFDLIDNSIDAARKKIIENDNTEDAHGLPISYAPYKIKVRLGDKSIIVEDNAVGIDDYTLEQTAFYTGKRSNHNFGIGHYGLGLKRALLKAGRKYSLVTDNGTHLYKANFDINTFSSDEDFHLVAAQYPSSNKQRTLFIVGDLYENVIEQIYDPEWMRNLINELSIRYSIFIRKGLKISIINSQKNFLNTFLIKPSVPKLRTDGLLKVIKQTLELNSTTSHFYVGVHEDYKFPGERDHDQKKNQKLTDSYGIYYIFNDRVIISASQENKHGFTTHWHSEYGGFVCLVYVTGKEPKFLPWNTAKTEVKINNPLFLQIRKLVEPLALKYRSSAKSIINIWTETKGLSLEERKTIFAKKTSAHNINNDEISAISRKKTTDEKFETKENTVQQIHSLPPKIKTKEKSSNSVNSNKNIHTKDWENLLPVSFPVTPNSHILNNLIIEATTLNIQNSPYASGLLYRSIFEAAFKNYVIKKELYAQVKEHYYSKGEGLKKNHNDEYKRRQNIDLSICAAWLLDSKYLFPNDNSKTLALCSRKLKEYIPVLNGIVHGNQLLGNDNQINKIRNDTIALLEFLTLC